MEILIILPSIFIISIALFFLVRMRNRLNGIEYSRSEFSLDVLVAFLISICLTPIAYALYVLYKVIRSKEDIRFQYKIVDETIAANGGLDSFISSYVYQSRTFNIKNGYNKEFNPRYQDNHITMEDNGYKIPLGNIKKKQSSSTNKLNSQPSNINCRTSIHEDKKHTDRTNNTSSEDDQILNDAIECIAHLRILDLYIGYTYSELRYAYRMKLKEYHPDFHEENNDQQLRVEMTKHIIEAYRFLLLRTSTV